VGLMRYKEWRQNRPEKATALRFEPNQIVEMRVGDERETFCPCMKDAIRQSDMSPNQVMYATNGCVDLSLDQWKSIKGVGPTLAKRLVESGPYHNIDDVKQVKGISGRTFERIVEGVNTILIPTSSCSSSCVSSDDTEETSN